MKKILLILSLIASSAAFATPSPILCEDAKLGPDFGYFVSISNNSAQVSFTSPDGSVKPVATLQCKSENGKAFSCTEKKADTGYILVVSQGGQESEMSATLSQKDIAGEKEIATFSCGTPN